MRLLLAPPQWLFAVIAFRPAPPFETTDVVVIRDRVFSLPLVVVDEFRAASAPHLVAIPIEDALPVGRYQLRGSPRTPSHECISGFFAIGGQARDLGEPRPVVVAVFISETPPVAGQQGIGDQVNLDAAVVTIVH